MSWFSRNTAGFEAAREHQNEHELQECAARYSELHPDRSVGSGLTSFVRRVVGRLPGRSSRADIAKTAPSSEDVWAREEALYRAKNEGEPKA